LKTESAAIAHALTNISASIRADNKKILSRNIHVSNIKKGKVNK
jgi:hypothetical protein